jgi:outer membrane receptor protein involved in Fe transport
MKTLGMHIVCILAFIVLVAHVASAETGSIQGAIYDEKTGEELIGANVWVVGTSRGAASGLGGRFNIGALDEGIYDIRVSYMGYGAKTVTGVEVSSQNPVTLNITLLPEAIQIEEISVTAERILSSSAAVLAQRKNSASIGDAISSEQISKSPDATSGDALKRVTGLSVVSNKYVFIRGVTDRYNETALNGVSLTSTDTDVDKKSFSFDLVPANLLENTVVVKTATPDLPGGFSGGLVQVNTLDFPSQRVIKTSISSSYNNNTSTRTMLASRGGARDWLGLDDGARELPGGLAGNDLAKALPNTWTVKNKKAPLNQSFNLSIGDHMIWLGDEFGLVGAVSYKNSFSTHNFVQKSSLPYIDFEGRHYEYKVLWGGMLNLSYQPSPLHKLSFENNFSQAAEDNVRKSEGIPESSALTQRQTIEWDERTLYAGQLSGEHNLHLLRDLELEWNASHSISEAREPDRKNVEYERGADGTYAMIENYRSWSDLNERSWGFDAAVTMPLGDTKIKVGTGTKERKRLFEVKVFHSDQSKLSWKNWHLVTLPLEEIFLPDNYGRGLFQFEPMTQFTGEYDGDHRINSYYAMVDHPFRVLSRRFRFVGGARLEDSDQHVVAETANPLTPFSEAEIKKADVLPSANLTHMLSDNTNLRMAFSQSVNRPEFREMADVKYYDFDEFQNVIGNPELERARIENYDLRFEVFPDVGEVVAVSYFYKDIHDAIEIRLIPEPTRFVRTWFNSPDGKNHGWEVEVRKRLSFFGDYFNNFTFTGNYTRVESAIEYVDKKTAPDGSHIIRTLTRPMQGQSPWMVNVSMLFVEPSWGSSINVLYNKIGRRLESVGDSRYEDVYQEPRDLLDVAVTQKLPGSLEVKFTAKDIMADDEEFTMGPGHFREPHSRIEKGTTYSLAVSVSL